MDQICFRNKYGYCKFGNTCRRKHNNNICENDNCEKWNCEKRHPKECWWFYTYQRCRFSNCSYKHTKKTDLKEEVIEINKKLRAVEEEIKKKESEIKAQEEKIRGLERKENSDLEIKVEMLEKLVVSLEKKVAYFEINLHKKDDEYEKGKQIEGKEVNEGQSLDEIIRENSLKFQCDNCDFKSKTQKQLQIHKIKAHSLGKLDSEKGRVYESWGKEFRCKICKFSIKEELEIREHMSQDHGLVHEEDYFTKNLLWPSAYLKE